MDALRAAGVVVVGIPMVATAAAEDFWGDVLLAFLDSLRCRCLALRSTALRVLPTLSLTELEEDAAIA